MKKVNPGINKMSGFRINKNNPIIGRRYSNQRELIKFVYIFAEGAKTEERYFNKLISSGKVREDIKIKFFSRWESRVGNSNQYYVVKNIEDYVSRCSLINSSDREEIKKISNELIEGDITIKQIIKLLELIQPLLDDEMISDKEKLVKQLNDMITMSEYESKYDDILIVLDRDRQSFKECQYEKVLEISKKQNFKLGISNPNFELFLLLHLDSLEDYDEETLIKNPKIGKKRLLEKKLSKKLTEFKLFYNKANYDPTIFVDNIINGLNNSARYEVRKEELTNKVGTNLFIKIKDLILK